MSELGITIKSDNPPVGRNAPIVSIGMPVYNGQAYIREALDSLLAQTVTDFELIISDNASTDDTREICLEYALQDSRIRYIRQDTNLGATVNFKFVLTEATGTFFMWAAHDDTWEKSWLQVTLSEICQTDMAVRGLAKIINPTGNIVGIPPVKSFVANSLYRFYLDDEKNCKAFHIYGLFWRLKLLLVPLNILKPNAYAADIFFLFQSIQHGNLRCITETSQHIRRHDASGGAMQTKNETGLLRLICLAHKPNFYAAHIAATPKNKKIIMLLLTPIKMIKSQFEIWHRGFMYFIFRKKSDW